MLWEILMTDIDLFGQMAFIKTDHSSEALAFQIISLCLFRQQFEQWKKTNYLEEHALKTAKQETAHQPGIAT